MKKPEILSPAGSYESLLAAIANGADAVYLGGPAFGARAFAGNLTTEKLKEAIDYVHYHGKHIYLTVNTLLKNHELEEQLYDYILPFYEQGLDAVIVQDMGVLRFLHEHFPELPLHASTQMTVTSTETARFLKKCGVTRIVPARELSFKEIRAIKEACGLEIESFVHGALCYCYSGQCLLSSMIGGRSGNRGRCAQPCRLPYDLKDEKGNAIGKKDETYRLSPKDLCAIDEIPQMVEAGIDSFKIEGRMKKPEYVAAVTGMYRKYVDQYFADPKKPFHVEEKDYKQLMELYNRGGFTDGYYTKHNGKDMMSMKRPNHQGLFLGKISKIKGNQIFFVSEEELHQKDVLEVRQGEIALCELTSPLNSKKGEMVSLNANNLKKLRVGQPIYRMKNKYLIEEMKKEWNEEQNRIGLFGEGDFQEGKRAKLTIFSQDISVTVEGDIVQSAQKQPMDVEKLRGLLNKTGGTEYYFEELNVKVEGSVFLPVQAVKELRRQGIQKWEEEKAKSYRREKKALPKNQENEMEIKEVEVRNRNEEKEITVSILKEEQLDTVLAYEEVGIIALELVAITMKQAVEMAKKIHRAGKKCYLALPQIFRLEAQREWEKEQEAIFSDAFDGYVIRNLEEYIRLLDGYQERKKKNDAFLGSEKEWVLDHTIYQYNHEAEQFYKQNAFGEKVTTVLPIELNYNELKQMNYQQAELVVYGRLPLMVSAQCQWKQTKGCIGESKPVVLIDRKQSEFFVINQCKYCYNTIYSDKPLCLYDKKEQIEELNVKRLRLQFVDETKEQIEKRLKEIIAIWRHNKEVQIEEKDFIRGHWKRGIE